MLAIRFNMGLADLVQRLGTRSGQIDQVHRNFVALEFEEFHPWGHHNGLSLLDLDVNVAPADRQRGSDVGRDNAQLVFPLEWKGLELGWRDLPFLLAMPH